jgi:imidazolonepropionase-like amidohydrolase
VYAAPAQEPVLDAVVLVGGTKILEIGTRRRVPIPHGVKTFDCSGRFLTAGFWNSHVHFFERKWADAAGSSALDLAQQFRDFTRYGFTTVFDLSSLWENTCDLRGRIDSGEISGPRIYSTGEGLVPPNAIPSADVCRVMGLMETPLTEVLNARHAGECAKRLVDKGTDGVKLFASGPRGRTLANGAIEAAVAVAHGAGRPVFVHPNTTADALAAIRAGADVVAHTTPHSGDWDEALLSEMRARPCALVPTLKLWYDVLRHDRASQRDRVVQSAVAQLRRWHDAGGAVLFGTDLGAVGCDPTREYLLMAAAGMCFDEILASLTTGPARKFGCGDRLGCIAAGFQADLVVLDADPASHVENLAGVTATMRAGAFVYGVDRISTFA